MKFIRDGVFRYGDNPTDLIDKYINNKPVNRVEVNQHRVVFMFDGEILSTVYRSEDYPEKKLSEISVIYYVQDTRVFLSVDSINPSLVGKRIKTEIVPDIKVESLEVGSDYVTFHYLPSRAISQSSLTVPFTTLGSWYLTS